MAKMVLDAPSSLMAHYPLHLAIPFFSRVFRSFFFFFARQHGTFLVCFCSLLSVPRVPPCLVSPEPRAVAKADRERARRNEVPQGHGSSRPNQSAMTAKLPPAKGRHGSIGLMHGRSFSSITWRNTLKTGNDFSLTHLRMPRKKCEPSEWQRVQSRYISPKSLTPYFLSIPMRMFGGMWRRSLPST
jgi:hypothetical protein